MENARTNHYAEYNMYNQSQLLKAAFAGYYRYLAFTAKNVLKPCSHWRLWSSETATKIVSEFGDCCNSATVAEFGDYCRKRRLSPNSAVVASVDIGFMNTTVGHGHIVSV